MAIYDEFLAMAKEMLDDPEIGADCSVVTTATIVPDPAKPWIKETVNVTKPVRAFRSNQKNKMVDGSLVGAGEAAFISYPPEGGIAKEQALGSTFVDGFGKSWKVLGFEVLAPATVEILYTYRVQQ